MNDHYHLRLLFTVAVLVLTTTFGLSAQTVGNPSVDLASFVLTAQGGSITLEWQTASEENNAGFMVERFMVPDSSYIPIATYVKDKALVGMGTSTSGKSYTFIDAGDLRAGKTYCYRLVVVSDVSDGGASWYGPQCIPIDAAGDVSRVSGNCATNPQIVLLPLSPNPVSERLQVEFNLADGAAVDMAIFSSDGNLVSMPVRQAHYAIGEHREVLDLQDIIPGAYTLRVTAGSKRSTQRFVIVR